MAEDQPSTVSKGASLEDQVQSLYEALGFKVERNVKVGGQQVDLIARRFVPGAGPITLVIECKYLSRGSLSNQAVHDFSAYLASTREHFGATSGVLICNRDFSADAKLAAQHNSFLQLKRLLDLERELLDVSDVLLHKTREYRESEAYRQYVTLSGTSTKSGLARPTQIDDVLTFLRDWALAGAGGITMVLGDFGSGKTTLLERLHFTLAERFVTQHDEARIPVFFILRDRARYNNLSDFVLATLKSQFETRIPLGLFWQQVAAGRFVLLLDGFDEISTHVTARQRAQIFLDLSPLLTSLSPVVITCRPTYFVNTQEYDLLISNLENESQRLSGRGHLTQLQVSDALLRKYVDRPRYRRISRADIAEVVLDVFDEKKIKSYLQKRDPEFNRAIGTSWEHVLSFLFGVYDLKDLMTRPILLSMIADTVIEGQVNLNDNSLKAGPTGLYEIYTGLQLERDTFRGEPRRFLTPQQRQRFAQAMALAMIAREDLVVSYDQIIDAIHNVMVDFVPDAKLDDAENQERIATDVLVCAFLSRQGDGYFRFIHKSFMEFFAAQYLKAGMDRILTTRISTAQAQSTLMACLRHFNMALPNEVLSFFANYEPLDSVLVDKIEYVMETIPNARDEDKQAVINVNSIALLLGAKTKGHRFFGGLFRHIPVRGTSWDGYSFAKCIFEEMGIDDTSTDGITFLECTFDRSTLRRTNWKRCRMIATVTDSQFLDSAFEHSDLQLSARHMISRSTIIRNSSLSLTGDFSITESELTRVRISCTGAQIRSDSPIDVRLDIRDSKLTSCSIILVTDFGAHDVRIINCDIRDCFLLSVTMDAESTNRILADTHNNIRGLVHVLGDKQIKPPIYEIVNDGLVLVRHGPGRRPVSGLADMLTQTTMKFVAPEEIDAWSQYVARVKAGGDSAGVRLTRGEIRRQRGKSKSGKSRPL